jgi:hypothetical protein
MQQESWLYGFCSNVLVLQCFPVKHSLNTDFSMLLKAENKYMDTERILISRHLLNDHYRRARRLW